MILTGAARLAGVIGWPIGHSLSPALHGYWLAEHGIDGAYVPLPVRREDFSVVLEGLRRAGFRGLNVTVPHKEAAFALAARHDEAAKATGAVNVLLFGADGIEGRNTDVVGLKAALQEGLGRDCVKGRSVAVWGAGGAARAAIHALGGLGAAEIRVFNRTVKRAETLIAALAPMVPSRLVCAGYERWTQSAADVSLLVHTTSAGMKDTPSLDLPLDGMPADAAVFDAVYNPLETGLLKRAQLRGLKTVDGLGMLMHQAVPAFAAFYGVEPRVTPALRGLLEKVLSGA